MTNEADYAIIQSGSKQYRVKPGDVIDVELIGENQGKYEFREVLFGFVGNKTHVGAPTVAKAVVKGEILAEVRGPKVVNFKYKKRKNYRRKVGHRQDYTRVKITEIAV